MEYKMDYVKLTPRDLELLIDCCQLVLDYKVRTLSKTNWSIFESEYLPSLITSLRENKFRIVSSTDNILVWLIDQICHSRRLVEGVKPTECIPLADTGIGESCLEFLRAASKGQVSYNSLKLNQQFTKLFT
jgi:hypothetical protein